MPLALAALAISPAQAQKIKQAVIQNAGQNKDANETTPLSAGLPTIQITIKGTVVDQTTSMALASVKLRQMGKENVQAITDTLGRFELNLSDRDKLSKFIQNTAANNKLSTIKYSIPCQRQQ